MSQTRLFQIVDCNCSIRREIYVSSLNELVRNVREKFGLTSDVKIVLESDGTIVDDEEYFATLDSNTCLMFLKANEIWSPPSIRSNVDEVDFIRPNLARLLTRLKNDASQLVMLSDTDLELLSDFDPETVEDFQNKNFLRDIQEACNLYLNERRDAKDYVQLIKMYHEANK